ncbi:response regulator [Ructibacterium gallinarum]|uniref:Stage 0 sporulation protein A homolog n=1 Tax=Ructibacterium gallinarum TaxID=2779355 RepID=A0A9D5M4A0_9FIRM|nr:response regulator [Ructibacterium gallinarum]MBE5040340.1 response regulator [Ructibacterium gallinarum]
MKLKIVIADDEAVILRGLRSCVKSLGDDVEIVGEAKNGSELLHKIEETKPHIVISDIAMPEMTGLDVLQKLADQPMCPYFILISGYQEFEYARQAVALNAAEYLLKPINEETLLQSILKIKKQIFGQENRDNDFGMESDEQKSFCVCALKSDISRQRDILRFLSYENYQAIRYREYVCIIFDAADFNFDLKVIHQKAREILKQMEQELQIEVWGGLGSICTGTQNIAASFKEAEKALQYNYFSDEDKIFCIKDRAVFPRPEGEGFSAEMEKLLHALRVSDQEAAQKAFALLCGYIRCDSMGVKEIAVMKLYALLEQIKRTLHHSEFEEMYDENVIMQELKNAERYLEATDYIWDMLHQFLSDPKEEKKKRDMFEIETIKEYIENHLSENIKLETIAKMIYMNSYYFSVFFKKHTGTNFKDYVAKVKMEKAYDLVQNTGMKMYEIAEQIGVCDQKHFSNMFKKYFGITPTELRRKAEKE